jgi:ABC-type transport system substrate-binding protein
MHPFLSRHVRSLLAGVAALALLVPATVPGVASARNASSTAASGTLTIDFATDFPTLDPAYWQGTQSSIPMQAIYQRLVTYAENSTRIIPDAATWSVSPNGLTYTFHLKKGLSFSNGEPVTAEDVVYSLNLLTLYDADGSEGPAPNGRTLSDIDGYNAWFNDGKKPALGVEGMSGLTAPNKSTVVIHLVTPQAYFLDELALESAAIIDPAVVKKYGVFNYELHAVGSGPYELLYWYQGEQMALRPNPYYTGPTPARLAEVIFNVNVPYSSQLQAFKEGAVDMIWQPDQSTEQAALSTPGLTKDLYEQPNNQISFYALNTTRAPFDNRDVRLAVNDAINRTEDLRLIHGLGSIMTQPLPPQSLAYEKSLMPYKYDPTLGRKLLAEAGYPHGFTATLVYTAAAPYAQSVSQNIRAQLAKVGIKMVLENLENYPQGYDAFVANPKNPFGMAWNDWYQDYPDPGAFLFSLLGSQTSGHNTAAWNDPAFDGLVEKADALPASKQSERLGLFDEAQAIELEQAPWVPMFYPSQVSLVQPWVYPHDPTAFANPLLGAGLPYMYVKKHRSSPSVPVTPTPACRGVASSLGGPGAGYPGSVLHICVSDLTGRFVVGPEIEITGTGSNAPQSDFGPFGLGLFSVDYSALPVGCQTTANAEGILWTNNIPYVRSLTESYLSEGEKDPFSVSTYVPLTFAGQLEICAYSVLITDTAAWASTEVTVQAK